MTKFLKIFLLILFINIFVFNGYQIGYTEPTQQTSSEYIEIINWLERNYSHEGLQINDISFQSLTQEHTLYIISFKNPEKKSYLVIKNNQEIIEYGEGSYTPYLTNIICDEEIRKLEANNFHYFSPFESYWQYDYYNEVVSIDGATGEWLPQISEPVTRNEEIRYFNIFNINTDSKKISKETIFDPYENMYWLLTDAEQITEQLTFEDIIDSINMNQKIIYIGAKYDGMVSFAYPIIGYQNIDELTYLAIYDQYLDLLRFIPYDEMKRFGDFSTYQR